MACCLTPPRTWQWALAPAGRPASQSYGKAASLPTWPPLAQALPTASAHWRCWAARASSNAQRT
eukprot:51548-Prorocentrum_lima.AAC.1